jgi:DNA polymerase III subunit beta
MATATADGLKINAGELLAALQDVTRVVSSRSPRPILANVRIGAGTITGTDLDTRIDRTLGADCESMLLPADRLTDILRSCRSTDEVTLTPSGSSVTVKCGRGSWTLPTEDAAEYPVWPVENAQPVCRLPADQFVRAVRAVSYAADSESSRYALGGVLIDVADGRPTFVATDGRRLAAVETETDQAVDDRTQGDDDEEQANRQPLLVPVIAIRLAASLADGDEGSVQIEATKSEVIFTGTDFVLTARLVEGRFPRWRDVFPEPTTEPHSVVRDDLLAATRAAAVVTSEASNGVAYDFAKALTLTAQSSEYGQSRVTCEIHEAGTACRVKMNPAFVRDYLSHLPSDEEPHVSILTNGNEGAVVLTTGDYRCVIMPLSEDAANG